MLSIFSIRLAEKCTANHERWYKLVRCSETGLTPYLESDRVTHSLQQYLIFPDDFDVENNIVG